MSYINLNIRDYVQSLLECHSLNAYSEKSILPQNWTFSQVLSHICRNTSKYCSISSGYVKYLSRKTHMSTLAEGLFLNSSQISLPWSVLVMRQRYMAIRTLLRTGWRLIRRSFERGSTGVLPASFSFLMWSINCCCFSPVSSSLETSSSLLSLSREVECSTHKQHTFSNFACTHFVLYIHTLTLHTQHPPSHTHTHTHT